MKNYKLSIDKLGVIGLFFIAISSPCCFPLFGFILTFFGFGTIELFGEKTMWLFQIIAVLSLTGSYYAFKSHKKVLPLIVSLFSVLLIFYGYYFVKNDWWIYLLYAGMTGLMIASILNYFYSKKQKSSCDVSCNKNSKQTILKSTITCPECGFKKEEIMPTDACAFFYKCNSCNTILKPLKGDCCVYCSYGTVKCPSIQEGNCC